MKGDTTLTVEFSRLTPAQAVTLKAMFSYWEYLGNIGSSREVTLYADGDGDFRPKITSTSSTTLTSYSDEFIDRYCIKKDNNGNRVYDHDGLVDFI